MRRQHRRAIAWFDLLLLLLSSLIQAQEPADIDCTDAPPSCNTITGVVVEQGTSTTTITLAPATSDEYHSTEYRTASNTVTTEYVSETYTPATVTETTTSTCTPDQLTPPPKAKRSEAPLSVCRTVVSVVTIWPSAAVSTASTSR